MYQCHRTNKMQYLLQFIVISSLCMFLASVYSSLGDTVYKKLVYFVRVMSDSGQPT
jgi:hypothetical protein